MLKREAEIKLDSKIEYHSGGGTDVSDRLVIYPPAMKHLAEISKIKGIFFEALKNSQNSNSRDDRDDSKQSESSLEIDADAANGIVYMYNAEKIADYLAAFKNILTNGCCKIDGKEDLASFILNKIPLSDFERICGEYFVNFLMPSLMKSKDRG